ncbi:hypothetical protein ACSNOI_40980 [Actinomadura kijaniata]|uniref:hypothetical protein n=1 Tax=Actinomadura kijaniata TaxID=46161 RepID=UPI003F19B0DE
MSPPVSSSEFPASDQQRVRVVVPDLVEDGLPDWSPLEEVLAVLEDWELQPVPAGMEPMRLRPPITGGIAHEALGRVSAALDRTQGEHALRAGMTGTLYSPAGDGERRGPGGGQLVERTPLRIVFLRAADMRVLAELPAALVGDEDVADAAEQVGRDYGITHSTPHGALTHMIGLARRLSLLLHIAIDAPAEQQALLDLLQAADPADDVVLDAAHGGAHRDLLHALQSALALAPLGRRSIL